MGFAAFMAYIRGKNEQQQSNQSKVMEEYNKYQSKEDELRHQLFEGSKKVKSYCQWLKEFDIAQSKAPIHKQPEIPVYPPSLKNCPKYPLVGPQLLNKAKRRDFLEKTCPAFQYLDTDQLVDMTDLSQVF